MGLVRREKRLEGVGKRGNGVGSSTIVGKDVRNRGGNGVKSGGGKKVRERKNRKNATGRKYVVEIA